MNQCECIVQSANKKKFYPPKIKKKEKKKKEKKEIQNEEKNKKLAEGWRLVILSNTHLSLFLSHFLHILRKLNFDGS